MRRTTIPTLATTLAGVLAAAALAGCGGSPSRAASPATGLPPGDARLVTDYGAPVPSEERGSAGSAGSGTASAAGAERSDARAVPAAGAVAGPGAAGVLGAVGSAAGTASSGAPVGPQPIPPVGPGEPPAPSPSGQPVPGDSALRAGHVDDNADLPAYLAYRRQALASGVPSRPFDVTERHVVTVVRPDGSPVLGARVALASRGDGQQAAGGKELEVVRTQPDGRALLFPLATDSPRESGYDVVVNQGAVRATAKIDDRAQREHRVVLDVPRPAGPPRLDVHFLVDTTGSMGDEIARLVATMQSVSDQVRALPQKPDVRYGLTLYRDHGDAYVTRTVPFTRDLKQFRAELGRVTAGGGGDTPEDLQAGLHGAVAGPDWAADAPNGAVQLVFLVADAAPHLDYDDGLDYTRDLRLAAEKGIAVVPIGSSGTDDAAEFVFRQLAQVTLGSFDFLTYGADGATPGDTTTTHVTGFTPTSLDALVVKEVSDRLAALAH